MTLWQALFSSVSSFNTAGIDIVGPTGFILFRNDTVLLSIATIDAVLGAIGFFALYEIPKVRRFSRFSLDTKIVITTTLTVYFLGTMGMFLSEYFHGTTLADFPIAGKAFTAFFNAVSASTTTGFATIDFGQATVQTLVIITGLMFIYWWLYWFHSRGHQGQHIWHNCGGNLVHPQGKKKNGGIRARDCFRTGLPRNRGIVRRHNSFVFCYTTYHGIKSGHSIRTRPF
jgi:hypothetical protein